MNSKLNFSFVLIAVIAVGASAACSSPSTPLPTNAANNTRVNASRNTNENDPEKIQMEANTNINELEKKIKLPVRPLEVKWTEEIFDNSKGSVPAPTDYRLTALLKYDEAGANQLIENLSRTNMEQSIGNTEFKDWFPADVKSKVQMRDGKTYLEGAKYSPEEFFRNPYRNGNLIRLGKTNYFILNLFSF